MMASSEVVMTRKIQLCPGLGSAVEIWFVFIYNEWGWKGRGREEGGGGVRKGIDSAQSTAATETAIHNLSSNFNTIHYCVTNWKDFF